MQVNDILKYGVSIGSRVYGVSNEDSDYDIVVTEEDYYKICPRNDAVTCSKIDKEFTEEYTFAVFGGGLDDIARFTSDDGKDINVFVFTDEYSKSRVHIYDRFRRVNELMMGLSSDTLMDKRTRVENFIKFLGDESITEIDLDGQYEAL